MNEKQNKEGTTESMGTNINSNDGGGDDAKNSLTMKNPSLYEEEEMETSSAAKDNVSSYFSDLFQLHPSLMPLVNSSSSHPRAATATSTGEEEAFQTKEMEPLLSSAPQNHSSTTTSSCCWSYSPSNSPWSIQQSPSSNSSDPILLSITYKYYHHSLPSYTNISYTKDITNRMCTCTFGTKRNRLIQKTRNSKSSCCSSSNSKIGPKKIQYQKDVYTTKDIAQIIYPEEEKIMNIKGVGECSYIQLYLTPQKRTKTYWDWKQKSVHSTDSNEEEKGEKEEVDFVLNEITKIAQQNKEKITKNMKAEIQDRLFQTMKQEASKKESDVVYDTLPLPPWMNDQKEGKERGDNYGPIVTFAIPKTTNGAGCGNTPPLLWKVQYPPDPIISIETITMLEGILSTSPPNEDSTSSINSSSCSSTDDDNSDPTHIYINGYQSWSFAGSVAKGKAQPKSAMPHFLSGAFNWGGSVPPPSVTTVSSSSLSDNVNGRNQTKKKNKIKLFKRGKGGGDSSSQEHNVYCSDFYTCVTSNHGITIPNTTDSNINDSSSSSSNNGTVVKLDENGGPSLILGWLSQHKQYGVITLDRTTLTEVAMHASCDGVHSFKIEGVDTDWAYCQIFDSKKRTNKRTDGTSTTTTDEGGSNKHTSGGYDEEPTANYLNAVAGYNHATPMKNGLLTGWCSWYHYYENIDEQTLADNFCVLNDWKPKITSNVAVVDDGYMTAWGDWNSMKRKQFPEKKKKMQHENGSGNSNGGAVALPSSDEEEDALKRVADTIRANGMKPGLWLAPFACDKKSKLAKDHPDWIIQNDLGRHANSSNCGKFFYGLDATNPQVLQHAFHAIRRAVKDWGYEVLKLDFLYAACLLGNGKHDLSMTRAQAMHNALRTLRDAAGPDVFLIGCGCPLGTAVGYVDGMRISADTGPTWYPAFPLPSWDNATLPSLRAMIRNSLTRSSLGHRWWHNDPDCVLLGKSTSLTEEEVTSAATVVAMTGGMMLLSDDLTKLSAGRLRVGTRIYPVTGATAVALDMHGAGETGFPSILRLWCTDVATNLDGESFPSPSLDPNADAVEITKHTAFSPDCPLQIVEQRKRSCVRVAKGLGTWSVVSLSNWQDHPSIVYAPRSALIIPPTEVLISTETSSSTSTALSAIGTEESKNGETVTGRSIETAAAFNATHTTVCTTNEEKEHGYHVFSFWSSKYVWLPSEKEDEDECSFVLSKKLDPHESEVFHIKPVVPTSPTYIGSDMHFTCGYEVKAFRFREQTVDLYLKNDLKRAGHIFIYVPGCTNDVEVTVNGEAGQKVEVIAMTPKGGSSSAAYVGRVLKIWVVIHGMRAEDDGKVSLKF